jgi:tetratricopeptide (TPR) repeat protein
MTRRGPWTRSMTALAVAALGMLVAVAGAAGSDLGALFDASNAAGARGEHDLAIQGYQRLLEAGVDDPDVYFNLATAHARAGRFGYAILHFERALALRPSDEGARRGLTAAQEALGARRAARTGEAVVDTGPPFPEALVRGLSSDLLALVLLGLNVALFGLLMVRRRPFAASTRAALGAGAGVCATLLVLAALLLLARTGVLREGAPGVVVAEEAVLREAPDPRAAQRGRALEGERVRVLDQHGRYLRVRLRGAREGWVTFQEAEPI